MALSNEILEKVYVEIQKRALVDADFRKKIMDNPKEVIEEMLGEKLPDDCKIKVIENDPAYTATLVLPDLISDEFSADELDLASGGVSVLLIVSACGAAIGTVACPADVCGAKGCPGNLACAAQACGTKGDVV